MAHAVCLGLRHGLVAADRQSRHAFTLAVQCEPRTGGIVVAARPEIVDVVEQVDGRAAPKRLHCRCEKPAAVDEQDILGSLAGRLPSLGPADVVDAACQQQRTSRCPGRQFRNAQASVVAAQRAGQVVPHDDLPVVLPRGERHLRAVVQPRRRIAAETLHCRGVHRHCKAPLVEHGRLPPGAFRCLCHGLRDHR